MSEEQNQESVLQVSESLLDGLTSALRQGRAAVFGEQLGLLDALAHPEPRIMLAAVDQVHEMGKGLTELVVKDLRFPGNTPLMICCESGQTGFYPRFMGVALVRRLLRTGDPEGTIRWLQKVLGTGAADGRSITALWGVPVERRIKLTDRVTIVPINELPDSPQKTWIIDLAVKDMNGAVMTPLALMPPTSALVVPLRGQPFIYNPEHPAPSHEEARAIRQEAAEATLALTLVGPRASIQAAHWFTFDDPDLVEASNLAPSRSQPMIEILRGRYHTYPPLDPDEAPVIVQAYLALKGRTRDKVRVALQRLSQAQRRHNLGDRAVELSTALEALMGDNAKTEMTHKIRVRSTRLIGGSDEMRRRNAAILDRAYSVRSSLVHTGQVDAASVEIVCGKRMSREEIIEHATSMCVDLIKIILRRGSIPDWSVFDVTEHLDRE